MPGRGNSTILSGQVALSTAATLILAARNTRGRVTIKNLDASITIYLGPSGVTTGTGFPLLAGESFTPETAAAIYGIAASGTPSVAYFTEFD